MTPLVSGGFSADPGAAFSRVTGVLRSTDACEGETTALAFSPDAAVEAFSVFRGSGLGFGEGAGFVGSAWRGEACESTDAGLTAGGGSADAGAVGGGGLLATGFCKLEMSLGAGLFKRGRGVSFATLGGSRFRSATVGTFNSGAAGWWPLLAELSAALAAWGGFIGCSMSPPERADAGCMGGDGW